MHFSKMHFRKIEAQRGGKGMRYQRKPSSVQMKRAPLARSLAWMHNTAIQCQVSAVRWGEYSRCVLLYQQETSEFQGLQLLERISDQFSIHRDLASSAKPSECLERTCSPKFWRRARDTKYRKKKKLEKQLRKRSLSTVSGVRRMSRTKNCSSFSSRAKNEKLLYTRP